MKKYISIILLGIAALQSCSKPDKDASMRFVVSTGYTKSEVITSSRINTAGNEIAIDGWLEADGRGSAYPEAKNHPHYINNTSITLVGSEWKNDDLKWRNLVWTNFWGVYPKSVTGRGALTWPATEATITDEQQRTPSFTYDMSHLSSSDSAAVQSQDLLVAFDRKIWNEKEKSGGEVVLSFKHLLAGIYFAKGEFTSGYDISEISIGGVALSGTCRLTGNIEGVSSDFSFIWTPNSTTGTLKQKGNLDKVTQPGFTSGNKVFFMIPQDMTTSSELSVNVTYSGPKSDPKTGVKSVMLDGYSWKAGYQYLYTLYFDENKNEISFTTTEYGVNDNGEWTD